MNPSHEKKKTRPCLLIGFRTGIDLALPLTGLSSGACHRVATLKPIVNAEMQKRIAVKETERM